MLYTGGTSSIAQARPGANLLPTLVAHDGGRCRGIRSSAAAGPLGGWDVSHSGDALTSWDRSRAGERPGAEARHHQYASGDVTLTSPRVDVEPGKTYLFKAFATSDADFSCWPPNTTPTAAPLLSSCGTHSAAGQFPVHGERCVRQRNTTTAVEYVFRLASKGTLRVEGAYLEAADDVRVPAGRRRGTNLIPDPALAGPSRAHPTRGPRTPPGRRPWNPGAARTAPATFLWTRIANYQNGEAKRQYQPVPVTADRDFEFGATYQSEREVDVVAEFELAAGGREFHNLETVPPAGEWTTSGGRSRAPAGRSRRWSR